MYHITLYVKFYVKTVNTSIISQILIDKHCFNREKKVKKQENGKSVLLRSDSLLIRVKCHGGHESDRADTHGIGLCMCVFVTAMYVDLYEIYTLVLSLEIHAFSL